MWNSGLNMELFKNSFSYCLFLGTCILSVAGNTGHDDNGSTENKQRMKRQSSTAISMQSSTYTFSVTSCIPGTSVGQVIARDTLSRPIYYLIDQPNNDIATNMRTGQLYLIDYLRSCNLKTVVIRATSFSGSSNATVYYSCGSGCTTGGVFSQSTYTFTVVNCTIGSSIGAVTAVSSSACTYNSSGSSAVYVVPSTGQLYLIGEFTGVQTIAITATCGTNTGRANATVSSSCSAAPVFTQQTGYTFTTASTAANTIIGITPAVGGTLYTIDGGSTTFAIDPNTGQLRSISTLTCGSTTIYVRAYSASGASSRVPVTVRTPTCTIQFYASLYSFVPTNCSAGAFIGQVSANSTGAITYSIDNPTGAYRIDANTGAIFTVGTVVAGTLTVRARSGTVTTTVPVTISRGSCVASGTAPVFGAQSCTFTTATCVTGSQVAQIFATSPSGSDPIQYSIQGGSAIFAMNTVTGALTAQVALNTVTPTTQTVVVAATDSASRTSTTTVTVVLNCAAGLAFSSSSYSFTATGTQCTSSATIGTVTATSNTGSPITYQIQTGIPAFAVDPTTGAVTAQVDITTVVTTPQTMIIRATDTNGARTATTTVTITPSCGGTGGTPTGGGGAPPGADIG
ncbi:mucin-2-like [Paramacrobiotus metropolitanus]|uniref:mucin-2-like n=1 Tax=Paramacrobiotus metropolitanus TaxID=2943436 RepID=UPI002445AE79|nr:mucin-2-like [Paramacrobiotus metropolitanus]